MDKITIIFTFPQTANENITYINASMESYLSVIKSEVMLSAKLEPNDFDMYYNNTLLTEREIKQPLKHSSIFKDFFYTNKKRELYVDFKRKQKEETRKQKIDFHELAKNASTTKLKKDKNFEIDKLKEEYNIKIKKSNCDHIKITNEEIEEKIGENKEGFQSFSKPLSLCPSTNFNVQTSYNDNKLKTIENSPLKKLNILPKNEDIYLSIIKSLEEKANKNSDYLITVEKPSNKNRLETCYKVKMEGFSSKVELIELIDNEFFTSNKIKSHDCLITNNQNYLVFNFKDKEKASKLYKFVNNTIKNTEEKPNFKNIKLSFIFGNKENDDKLSENGVEIDASNIKSLYPTKILKSVNIEKPKLKIKKKSNKVNMKRIEELNKPKYVNSASDELFISDGKSLKVNIKTGLNFLSKSYKTNDKGIFDQLLNGHMEFSLNKFLERKKNVISKKPIFNRYDTEVSKENHIKNMNISIEAKRNFAEKKRIFYEKQQEVLDQIYPQFNLIQNPYMDDYERIRIENIKNKDKYLFEKGFNVATGVKYMEKNLPIVKNYVNISPSEPPLNHKFRDINKPQWLDKEGFKP